jgi:hypothetical protein
MPPSLSFFLYVAPRECESFHGILSSLWQHLQWSYTTNIALWYKVLYGELPVFYSLVFLGHFLSLALKEWDPTLLRYHDFGPWNDRQRCSDGLLRNGTILAFLF